MIGAESIGQKQLEWQKGGLRLAGLFYLDQVLSSCNPFGDSLRVKQ